MGNGVCNSVRKESVGKKEETKGNKEINMYLEVPGVCQ